MDDNTEITAARDGTVPQVRRRASISAVSEPSLISIGVSEIRSCELFLDPSVGQQLKCAALLGCGGCDNEWHCR